MTWRPESHVLLEPLTQWPLYPAPHTPPLFITWHHPCRSPLSLSAFPSKSLWPITSRRLLVLKLQPQKLAAPAVALPMYLLLQQVVPTSLKCISGCHHPHILGLLSPPEWPWMEIKACVLLAPSLSSQWLIFAHCPLGYRQSVLGPRSPL